MPENPFASLIQQITAWVETRQEIQAALLVGSLARQDHPADRWSDLDVVVYTTYPQVFLQDDRWLHQFGQVWAQAIDETPRGDPEWFVFYAPGLKVDILFVDIASLDGESLADWALHPQFNAVYARGVRVLADKTASRGRLPAIRNTTAVRPPKQAELTALVHRFWLSAVRAARLIDRGDLWRGREACDEEMKQPLLRMLEWHALAVYGPDHDVWYDGRFLSEWAETRALERLPACFGRFQRAALLTAFINTLNLFEDLGRETAARLALQYPQAEADSIRGWLMANLSLTK